MPGLLRRRGGSSGPQVCEHLADAHADAQPHTREGCEDCLREDSTWVHLRLCTSCGHVGCCDSSPRRHASAHAREPEHPVVRSFEPGEQWRWCYLDEELAAS